MAVDLFGGAGDQAAVRAGELPLAEQKQLYQDLFGAKEAQARSARDQLGLALKLKTHFDDDDFLRMRTFLLQRMKALSERSKTVEAYDLRIFIFYAECEGREVTHAQREELIDILQAYLKKVDREQETDVAKQIVEQYNLNAQTAVQQGDYGLAVDDYKTMSKLLKKLGDKEGAQQAKDAAAYIDDYIDQQEEFTELLQEARDNVDDLELQEEVGRFYMADERWADAAKFLAQAQVNVLAEIAACAAQDAASKDAMAQSIVSIRKALDDRATQKDKRLYRALLNLGLRFKHELDQDDAGLSTALQMKYALAAVDWEKQVAELGPNYLKGMSVGDSSSGVGEGRLLQMGWVSLFDHKTPHIVGKYAEGDILVRVRDGMLIIKKALGQTRVSVDQFPDLSAYKAVKMRFRFVGTSYGWLTLGGGWRQGGESAAARVIIRNDQVGLSNGYAKEFGVQTLVADEWNDITMAWDGRFVTASLNGVEFEQKAPFPLATPAMANFFLGGIDAEMELHIQSFMALER